MFHNFVQIAICFRILFQQEVKKGPDSREIQAKPVKKIESAPQEPFVRPHGFERGLTVERIHGFIQRADLLFAVVQFKNCDVVEILATQIVKHYEPMLTALSRYLFIRIV
ncbi:hypothetical protein TELCIR_14422 [Teladorsagia circumcincta]|uniref:Uncharacterized protein n=1 Tax=Teladorsagia circumcincta TaxID=45464 RepID=A0A2G9U1A4_TELCI|nr:hypothetical protein TELCIR_14422 [Teladorsagia circumcincta]